MEYSLEMVCSCVCRARQRTQRREWGAWPVKASETVMNREPAALPKGPVANYATAPANYAIEDCGIRSPRQLELSGEGKNQSYVKSLILPGVVAHV